MGESPIERRQREFVEASKVTRPAKTAGSEYFGVLIIVVVIVAVVAIAVMAMQT